MTKITLHLVVSQKKQLIYAHIVTNNDCTLIETGVIQGFIK